MGIVGVIILLVLAGVAIAALVTASGAKRPCPFCHTMMPKKIIKCPHCRKAVPLGY